MQKISQALQSLAPIYSATNLTDKTPKKLSSFLRFSENQIPLSQDIFLNFMQNALETHYKKPLPSPSEITVRNLEGKIVHWNSLTFAEQYAIIMHHHKGGCTTLTLPYEGPNFCEPYIARWTHGLMHASRAALIVRMLANMVNHFVPSQKLTEKEILLAQFLAVYHDSARQAEGVDVWDDESAENIIEPMKDMGFDEQVILDCVQILKDKDNPRSDKSILSKLVQGADCLDIMRIYGFDGFNENYLEIYKDLQNNTNFCAELTAFRRELSKFIKETDSPLIRLHLESQSSNYFQDVHSLMLRQENGKATYPLLSKWMSQTAPQPRSSLIAILKADIKNKLGDYFIIQTMKTGTHSSYLLQDAAGKLCFFKETKTPNLAEMAASSLCNDLTDGLVPLATYAKIGSKIGVFEPFVELDEKVFKDINGFNPAQLTLSQQQQLFSHMISDYVVRNYDAHTGQFGIDLQGRVIGYDKGLAFDRFSSYAHQSFYTSEPAEFEPNYYWPPLYPDQPTYKIFAQYLLKNPTKTKHILQSPTVRHTFKRCQTISADRTLYELDKAFPGSKLLEMTALRAQNAAASILSYFN